VIIVLPEALFGHCSAIFGVAGFEIMYCQTVLWRSRGNFCESAMVSKRTAIRSGLSALVAALALGGCSSQIIDFSGDELAGRAKDAAATSQPVPGQTAAGQPAPGQPAPGQPLPGQPAASQPVNNVPQTRENAVITPEQRAKIEAELKAAREHQEALIRDADQATSHAGKKKKSPEASPASQPH